MPRGRRPIPRTEQERAAARREQVRRNVAAFRQRQQLKNSGALNQPSAQDKQPPPTRPKRKSSNLEDSQSASGSSTASERSSSNSTSTPSSLELQRSAELEELWQGHTSGFTSTLNGAGNGRTRERPGMKQRLDQCFNVNACQDQTALASLKYRGLCSMSREIDTAKVYSQQFLSTAIALYMPGKTNHIDISPDAGVHWTQMIPRFVQKDDVFDLSVQALCAMQLSQANQDEQLRQTGRSFYGAALGKLRTALLQPKPTFRGEVFGASMLLATFELFHGSLQNGYGWVYHAQGASHYLRMCGNSVDLSDTNHQLLFHFLEAICVFDSLGRRKTSSFAKSKWWKGGIAKFGGGTYGPLLRLITDLPAYLEDCDDFLQATPGLELLESKIKLLLRGLRLQSRFLEWHRATEMQDPDFRYEIDTSSPGLLDGTRHAHVFPGHFVFRNVYIARLFVLYWSCMILLHETTAQVSAHLADPGSHPGSETADHQSHVSAQECYVFVTNICQSLQYCLLPSHRLIGSTFVVLPMWISRNYLQYRYPAQAEWCAAALDRLAEQGLNFGLQIESSVMCSMAYDAMNGNIEQSAQGQKRKWAEDWQQFKALHQNPEGFFVNGAAAAAVTAGYENSRASPEEEWFEGVGGSVGYENLRPSSTSSGEEWYDGTRRSSMNEEWPYEAPAEGMDMMI